MDWKYHIESSYKASRAHLEYGSLLVFKSAAGPEEISATEVSLRTVLPDSMKELFRQTNGVYEEMNVDDETHRITSSVLVFPIDELRQLNMDFRSSRLHPKQDFSNFVFFGTAGVDGIYFAFGASDQNPNNNDEVYAWYPADRDFVKVSENFADFTHDWITDAFSI